VPPAGFLPILESAGLMPAIGAWALNRAAFGLPGLAPGGSASCQSGREYFTERIAAACFEHEVGWPWARWLTARDGASI